MSEYLCVLLTSHACGHCSQLIGNGEINNGKHYMVPATIREYFSSSDGHNSIKIDMINIHFDNMMGKLSMVDRVSKITMSGKKIKQEIYYKEGDVVKIKNLEFDKSLKTNQKEVIEENNKGVSWKTFIDKKIPSKIENYSYYYPCFMVLKRSNWKECIDNKEVQLVAITNAGFTIEDKEKNIRLDKSPATFNQRNVQIKDLIHKIISGEQKIEPHKSEAVVKNIEPEPKPEPIKKTEKEPEPKPIKKTEKEPEPEPKPIKKTEKEPEPEPKPIKKTEKEPKTEKLPVTHKYIPYDTFV